MAASTSPDAGAAGAPATRRVPTIRVIGSVLLALAIVAGAWYVTGREATSDLGKGGVNLKLLPKEGDPAPNVLLTDILGNQIQLSDLKGRAVWLNFWGSWCQPCRAEMPEIQAAWSQLKDQGIVLLAVSLDEPAVDAALFAARNDATFPVYTDQYREATGSVYPIYNFPTHIFIDKDGIVRHVVLSVMTTEQAVDYAQQTIAGR